MKESNKLFVGGLAWATDDHGLREAFEAFGPVTDSKVVTDRETGRSRGFGFVTFENADHAKEAMTKMDGADLDGRQIRVNEANERQPRRGGGGGGYGGGGRGGYGGGGGGYGGGGRGGYGNDRGGYGGGGGRGGYGGGGGGRGGYGGGGRGGYDNDRGGW